MRLDARAKCSLCKVRPTKSAVGRPWRVLVSEVGRVYRLVSHEPDTAVREKDRAKNDDVPRQLLEVDSH